MFQELSDKQCKSSKSFGSFTTSFTSHSSKCYSATSLVVSCSMPSPVCVNKHKQEILINKMSAISVISAESH